MSKGKKLVTVKTISMSMTASQEVLQCMPCIEYPIQFSRNRTEALVNSGSEGYIMNLVFVQVFDTPLRLLISEPRKSIYRHLEYMG